MNRVAPLLRAVPLTTGALPWLLAVAVGIGLLASLWRRVDAKTSIVAVAVAAAVVGAIRVALPGSVDTARIPTSFYFWFALPLAVGVMVFGSRTRSGPRRRHIGAATVALATALAANQVNVWFAYYPTLADLVGAPLPQQTALDRLSRATGTGALRHGAVVALDLPAERSGFVHRRALVWLPPAALAGGRPLSEMGHRPVVMLLAGTPGAPDDLLRAGNLARVASAYAAEHQGEAPILVLPDHNGAFGADSECVGRDGQAERYLTVDVPTAMARRFGTAASRWGVFGYSEGGTCAVMLSLRHPELFRAFVDIAGDARPNLGHGAARDRVACVELYGGDVTVAAEHDPLQLLAAHRFDGLSGWFVAGRADPPARRAAAALAPAAAAAGIDTVVTTPRGHHSFELVNRASGPAFSWLAARLAAPPAGAATSSVGLPS